jgi:hypothetical protein
MNWQTNFESEMERARAARARENEGQARVCARRAAGIVIREYLTRRGIPVRNPSAYDLLNHLAEQKDLDPTLRRAAERITVRVTESFSLPLEADLLEEAQRLRAGLLGE